MTRVGLRECECCGSVIDDGRTVIEIGDLWVDRQFQSVIWKGRVIRLTGQQFGCLELMVTRAGKLIPRTAFFISVLNEESFEKQIDVIICRLRFKFRQVDPEFDRILTSWGRGYAWLLPEQERLAA